MKAMEIEEHARKLRQVHGDKAIAEAARKAVDAEAAGNAGEAENWRRIEKALLLMRGANES